jgi:hypothetical protein
LDEDVETVGVEKVPGFPVPVSEASRETVWPGLGVAVIVGRGTSEVYATEVVVVVAVALTEVEGVPYAITPM